MTEHELIWGDFDQKHVDFPESLDDRIAAMERFNPARFYRENNVFRIGDFAGKIVELKSTHELPTGSMLHLMDEVARDEFHHEDTPDVDNNIFIQRESFRKFIFHVRKPNLDGPITVDDKYIYRPAGLPSVLMKFRSEQGAKFKYCNTIQEIPRKNEALVIVNHNPVFRTFVYGRLRYFRRMQICLASILNTIEEMSRLGKRQYLFVPWGPEIFDRMAFVRTRTKLSPITVRFPESFHYIFMMHLANYMWDTATTSFFDKLSDDTLKQLTLVLNAGNKFLFYNMSDIKNLNVKNKVYIRFINQLNTLSVLGRLSFNSSPEVKAEVEKFISAVQSENNSEEANSSEGGTTRSEDTLNDGISPAEETPIVFDVRDEVLDQIETETSSDPIENAIEEEKVSNEKDLKTEKVISHISNVIPQPRLIPKAAPVKVIPEAAPKKKSSTSSVKDALHQQPKNETVVKDITDEQHRNIAHQYVQELDTKTDEFVDNQDYLSPRQKERFKTLAKQYKTIEVGGETIEQILLNSNDLELDTAEIPNEVVGEIPDKSALKSSVQGFERSYINNTFKKHLVSTLTSFQKNGVYLKSVKEQKVVSEMNNMITYTCKYEDIQGKESTIKFTIPIVDREGRIKIDGKKQILKKQRISLPIVKISDTEVSLASNYNKTRVERNLNKAHSFFSFIDSFVNDQTKSDAVVEYGSGYPNIPLSYEYCAIADHYHSVHWSNSKGQYDLYFEYNTREQHFDGKKEELYALEGNYGVYFGRTKENWLFIDVSNEVFAVSKYGGEVTDWTLKSIIDIFKESLKENTTIDKMLSEWISIKILDKQLPVIFMLAYRYGLRNILDYMGIKYTVTERRAKTILSESVPAQESAEIPGMEGLAVKDASEVIKKVRQVNETIAGRVKSEATKVYNVEIKLLSLKEKKIKVEKVQVWEIKRGGGGHRVMYNMPNYSDKVIEINKDNIKTVYPEIERAVQGSKHGKLPVLFSGQATAALYQIGKQLDAEAGQENFLAKVKKITFPKDEIPDLSKKDILYTTRVSSDFKNFKQGDIVEAPWGKIYKIVERREFTKIKDHPFYKELTDEQKKFIGQYAEYAVLKLVSVEMHQEGWFSPSPEQIKYWEKKAKAHKEMRKKAEDTIKKHLRDKLIEDIIYLEFGMNFVKPSSGWIEGKASSDVIFTFAISSGMGYENAKDAFKKWDKIITKELGAKFYEIRTKLNDGDGCQVILIDKNYADKPASESFGQSSDNILADIYGNGWVQTPTKEEDGSEFIIYTEKDSQDETDLKIGWPGQESFAYHIVGKNNELVEKHGIMSPRDLYNADRRAFHEASFEVYMKRTQQYLRKTHITDEDVLNFLDNSPIRKPFTSKSIFFSFIPNEHMPFIVLQGTEYQLSLDTIKKYSTGKPILVLGRNRTQVSWSEFERKQKDYEKQALAGAKKDPKIDLRYKFILHFAVDCDPIPFRELKINDTVMASMEAYDASLADISRVRFIDQINNSGVDKSKLIVGSSAAMVLWGIQSEPNVDIDLCTEPNYLREMIASGKIVTEFEDGQDHYKVPGCPDIDFGVPTVDPDEIWTTFSKFETVVVDGLRFLTPEGLLAFYKYLQNVITLEHILVKHRKKIAMIEEWLKENKSDLKEENFSPVSEDKRYIPKPNDIAIKFQDRTLWINRYPLKHSLIVAGLESYDLTPYSMADFESRDIYYQLLQDKGLSTNYLKGIDSFYDLFVDPMTYTELQRMGEPTEVRDLLIRCSELLSTLDHRNASAAANHRIRGYEQFNAILFNELSRSFAAYQAKRGKANTFSINPDAVYLRIVQNAALVPVESASPLADIRETTYVTHAGIGGRTSESFVINDRKYAKDDVGIISEATTDNSKVAINIQTSWDPTLKDSSGNLESKDYKDLEPANILSPASLIMPFSVNDDQRNLGRRKTPLIAGSPHLLGGNQQRSL